MREQTSPVDLSVRLLELLDYLNRRVKEGSWYREDASAFYQLKDEAMERFHVAPFPGMEVSLSRVPYWKRCVKCKDAAGVLMRSTPGSVGFEHYLELVPVCESDEELVDRATVEMDIRCGGRRFCFHVQSDKAEAWGVDVRSLAQKPWIPSGDFHHQQIAPLLEEVRTLLQSAAAADPSSGSKTGQE